MKVPWKLGVLKQCRSVQRWQAGFVTIAPDSNFQMSGQIQHTSEDVYLLFIRPQGMEIQLYIHFLFSGLTWEGNFKECYECCFVSYHSASELLVVLISLSVGLVVRVDTSAFLLLPLNVSLLYQGITLTKQNKRSLMTKIITAHGWEMFESTSSILFIMISFQYLGTKKL